MSKNHDFHSILKPDHATPLLVQYREFLPSVVSEFELFVRSGHRDTAAEFARFAHRKARAHSLFVRKWAKPEWPGERLIVQYEDLTAQPARWLSKAIMFLAPDHGPINRDRVDAAIAAVDSERIENRKRQIIRKTGVKPTRKIESFRFFDEQLFDELKTVADSPVSPLFRAQGLLHRIRSTFLQHP